LTPVTDQWRLIDQYLSGRRIRIGPPTVGQTTGGRHTSTSYHYAGQARDYGRSNSDLRGILAALLPHATGPAAPIVELFGLDVYCKNGRRITPSAGLRDSHQDHVHVALRPGGALPVPLPLEHKEDQAVADNPEIHNIEGPLQIHVLADQEGNCTGYAIFSISTGELHGYGPGWRYWGRSEDPTPE
jgi:hypothetical protein